MTLKGQKGPMTHNRKTFFLKSASDQLHQHHTVILHLLHIFMCAAKWLDEVGRGWTPGRLCPSASNQVSNLQLVG
jgi:hypothetical protein